MKLWLSDRLLPHAPIGGIFPILSSPFDYSLVILCWIGFAWTIYRYRPKIIIGLLIIFAVLCLQDQMRWQPWVFVYLLLLIPYALQATKVNKGSEQGMLKVIQITLIGMYLWGGLHKFTPSFSELLFPSMLRDLFRIGDETLISQLSTFAFLIPAIEVLVAIGLTIKKTRKLSVILAIGTHLYILAYLSPLGINHNTIVYPWNVAAMLLVFFAFYGNTDNFWHLPKQHRLSMGIAALFAIVLPALNLAGKWDHYLSFNLYTDDQNDLYIFVNEAEVLALPDFVAPFTYPYDAQEDYQYIHANSWAFEELNVPIPPQSRVFKLLAKGYCQRFETNDYTTFAEIQRHEPREVVRQYSCQEHR